MHRTFAAGMIMAVLCLFAESAQGQRLGLGAHYWRTVDTVPDGFDRDGLSYRLTFQNNITPLLHYQVDLERFPSGFGGIEKAVYAPQAMLLVGRWVYGGVGAGILYSDGDFADRPFYLFRAGLDLSLLPRIRLDINANYHFSEWRGLSEMGRDIDTDTVTLGAALRFVF